mmetsp:Transcript_6099/g.6248  ORF Transcript_6099/g.6248 Transcript_6099/m.6248 type:complete len:479 (-) Transcript_6099:635-2071(-)
MLIQLASKGGPLLQGALKLNGLVAIGSLLEKKHVFSQLNIDSCTLSFLLASTCSNFLPTAATVLDPRLEVLGWSYLLQGALICGLWAGKSKFGPELQKSSPTSSSWKKWIPTIAVFLIGSFGSLIGGLLGFHAAQSSSISRDSLSILSACLTASYIGGTVNFFETSKSLGATGSTLKRLLVNMASIDIGVMVAYFWLLKVIRNSSMMNLLPKQNESAERNTPEKETTTSMPNSGTPFWMILPSIVVSTSITFIANFIQDRITIPGISVMFVTVAGLTFYDLVQKISGKIANVEETNSILIRRQKKFIDAFGSNSGKASDYMMSLFYTTIGLTFKFEAVSKPVCILMGVTLATHLVFIFAGSLLYNSFIGRLVNKRILRFDRELRKGNSSGNFTEEFDSKTNIFFSEEITEDNEYLINLDTAIIASNACVGGAGTAAQMASTMAHKKGGINLVVAASSIGTLGYLIGTPIGLALAKVLR